VIEAPRDRRTGLECAVADAVLGLARCPGFVRISDMWPRSGHGPDGADRDLARFAVARRLLFALA
jgi:hypothetical protein